MGEPSARATMAVPDRRARRALLEVLAEAFRDNPMNIAIHGANPARRVRANRAGLRALVLRPTEATVQRGLRVEGRLIGGLVAVRPGEFPLRNIRIPDQIGCLIHQGWKAMRQWDRVHHELVLNHPRERHWYLAALGVLPSAWGQGWGSELLAELRRIVATDPAPIYLESDRDESVRFYQGRGFLTSSEHEPLGVRCTCLVC